MIFVMAATNRIDAIDAALLRKGRFDHCLRVDYPTAEDAVKLFAYFGRKFRLSEAQVASLVAQHIAGAGDGTGDGTGDGAVGEKCVAADPVYVSVCSPPLSLAAAPLSGAEIENICKERALTSVRAMIAQKQM